MSSSPHYCKCIGLHYPKHRKVFSSRMSKCFFSRYKDIKLSCLSQLKRGLKAKPLVEVAVSSNTEDSLLI